MIIDKSCRTCEFNFHKICACANYGEKINEEDIKDCWSIGLDYYLELRDKLTEKEKRMLDKNITEDSDELLFKILENK